MDTQGIIEQLQEQNRGSTYGSTVPVDLMFYHSMSPQAPERDFELLTKKVYISFEISLTRSSSGIHDIDIVPQGQVDIDYRDGDDVHTLTVDFESRYATDWMPGSQFGIQMLILGMTADGKLHSVTLNCTYLKK